MRIRRALGALGAEGAIRRMGRRSIMGFATLATLAAVWYLATVPLALISPGRFPSPLDVWVSLRQVAVTGYANGVLHDHVVHSLKLVALGFARRVLPTPAGCEPVTDRYVVAIGKLFSYLAYVPRSASVESNGICRNTPFST